MAELTFRTDLETEFAARIAKLSAKQRQELVFLMGEPPDLLNVPPEKWKEWEEENRDDYFLMLLLIASASAELHGAIPGASDVVLAITGWATQRSQELAGEVMRTTQERLAVALDEMEQEAIEEALASQAGEAVEATDFEEKLEKVLDTLFGEQRAEAIAITETTVAQHAGAEIGIGSTVGTSQDDIWKTEDDKKVCPTCSPLNGKPRSYWERFFPKGPGSTHTRCRCWIEYANQEQEAVTQ